MISENLEARMKKAFDEKSLVVKRDILEKEVLKPIVGLELEFGVFDEQGRPVRRKDVDDPKISKELGHHQIEIITDPILIDSIESFKSKYQADLETSLAKLSQKVSGVGSIPNLSAESFEITPDVEKYEKVPAFNNERVLSEYKTLFPNLDARHVGLFNAMQINLDCSSIKDAVSKLNKSLSISPYLVALFGNARFLEGEESGFKDCRVKVWEETHDIRTEDERRANVETRIGLPNKYFSNVDDYFSRISKHPFIFDKEKAAFEIGIGLNWHDARIKFIEKENKYLPVVEMRSISSQQSLDEEVAATLMYVGLLESEKGLLSMDKLEFNRESALKHGLHGFMYDKSGLLRRTLDVVKDKVEVAKQGLLAFGYSPNSIEEAFEPVYKIISEEKSPADRYDKNHITQLVRDSFRN